MYIYIYIYNRSASNGFSIVVLLEGCSQVEPLVEATRAFKVQVLGLQDKLSVAEAAKAVAENEADEARSYERKLRNKMGKVEEIERSEKDARKKVAELEGKLKAARAQGYIDS